MEGIVSGVIRPPSSGSASASLISTPLLVSSGITSADISVQITPSDDDPADAGVSVVVFEAEPEDDTERVSVTGPVVRIELLDDSGSGVDSNGSAASFTIVLPHVMPRGNVTLDAAPTLHLFDDR